MADGSCPQLPRALALLGLCRGVLVEGNPDPSEQGTVPGGKVEIMGDGLALLSSGNGRELWIMQIRGLAEPAQVEPRGAEAARAWRLRESFTDRAPEGFSLGLVEAPTRCRFAGWALIIRYWLERGRERPEEYEHYFAGDGSPRPPVVFELGHGQLYLPRGPFISGSGGIRYHGGN